MSEINSVNVNTRNKIRAVSHTLALLHKMYYFVRRDIPSENEHSAKLRAFIDILDINLGNTFEDTDSYLQILNETLTYSYRTFKEAFSHGRLITKVDYQYIKNRYRITSAYVLTAFPKRDVRDTTSVAAHSDSEVKKIKLSEEDTSMKRGDSDQQSYE